MSELLKIVTTQLAEHLRTVMEYRSHESISGGDINQTFILETSTSEQFFVKANRAELLDMFLAEFAALEEIKSSNTLLTPLPILAGSAGDSAFLVMDFIEMAGASETSEEVLGHGLAEMHKVTKPKFGWDRNNTIGSTKQINRQESSWGKFWKDHRIAPQLQWAAQQGAAPSIIENGRQLLAQIESILVDHNTIPSLLHGDLWGGNWSTTKIGDPIIYDPALYYGDRETDLAMTELFGGFSNRFYNAYNESWTLSPGYTSRKDLYNLYHILNHFNLFGGGYGRQAENLMERILQNRYQ
ncbi:MAG: fructosamine kinase family protein [Gammaproteobacteria bacterium]|uniref:Fructosamine kinase family protein n=1 Tax=Candidatus Thiopontia autotrophica TaxID=2841688 RepID=A0A8J6NYK9_9GAMM|nr:fructosamine kinase family protein [Candidatus Thiopontia autotrophica]MBL6969605.1 fructosamine kinase family protein [Gammaproteobacteria bacterium]